METHRQDAKPDRGGDPWDEVASQLRGLGEKLKDTYRQVADERGPTEGEVRDAFGTLAGAFGQVAESVGGALRDPEVRDHLRQAVSAFASALGATISGLGSELDSEGPADEDPGRDDAGPAAGQPPRDR